MTSDAVATAPLETGTEVVPSIIAWRDVIRIGLIGGAIAIYLCLVGIVPVFHQRQLIAGVITLGQVALFGSMALPGACAARKATTLCEALLTGAVAGLLVGAGVIRTGGVKRRLSSLPAARMLVSFLARSGLTSRSLPRVCSPMTMP